MKFTSAHLENFQCYYGTDNYLEFNDGLNVVVGANGAGKSSLFNAFTWCLTNKFYHEDEKVWTTVRSPSQNLPLVNLGAINNKSGNKVIVAVTIGFELNDPDLNYTELQLKKSFSFEDAACGRSELLLTYKVGAEVRTMTNQDQIVSNLHAWMDPEISKFMLFQGETLDELVNFQAKDSLRALTNKISHFTVFDDFATDLTAFQSAASRQLMEQVRKYNMNDTRLSQYSEELARVDEQISKRKALIEELKVEINEAVKTKELADDVIKRTANSHDEWIEVKKLESESVRLGEKVDGLTDRLSDACAQGRLLGVAAEERPLFFAGVDLLEVWVDEKRRELGHEYDGVISMNIPTEHDLDKLIKKGHCEICGTDAPEGSPAWEHMKARLEKMQSLSNLGEDIRKLESLRAELPELMSSFDRIRTAAIGLDRELRDLHEKGLAEWRLARDAFREAERNLSPDAQASKEFGDAMTQAKHAKRQIDIKSAELESKKESFNGLALQKRVLQRDIDAIPISSAVDPIYAELKTLSDFGVEFFAKIRDDERQKLLIEIEEAANSSLRTVARESKSFVATLKVDEETMSFKPVDKNGNSVPFNKGLLDMCSISVLTAVLNLVEKRSGVSYPHITDAPTSDLDRVNTTNYLRLNENCYKQSIVLSKDFSVEEVLAMNLKKVSITSLQPLTLDGKEIEGQDALLDDLKIRVTSVKK